MSEAQIITFMLTSLAVIASPGQDMILVMSRAISQGAKAGIATAFGVSVGLLGHTLLTAFGLGSLLLASQTLFTVLKFIGAGYLFYLGIRLIFSNKSDLALKEVTHSPLRKLFREGAISNLSNPKVTIFYFAFLPQFISADVSNPTLLLFTLGVAFAAITFLIKGPVGFFAGNLSSWLRARPRIITWIDRISGFVLIGLGLRLAFERNP
ncbi:MAG: LysE family translocator [Chloroflexota bacterium]